MFSKVKSLIKKLEDKFRNKFLNIGEDKSAENSDRIKRAGILKQELALKKKRQVEQDKERRDKKKMAPVKEPVPPRKGKYVNPVSKN